jgi:hypothetical protein
MKSIYLEKGILIGAVHFPPLLGYPDFPGYEIAFKNALFDLQALEKGGVNAIVVENNYDIPHRAFIAPETAECMKILTQRLQRHTKLPIGISVLWNDYKTAFSIAKELGLSFIRVPVFVDDVETSYGKMFGNSKDVIATRKALGAEDVAIFADVHVKHSTIISKHTLEESAKLAIKEGADALIITGKWTGDAPDLTKLTTARKAAGDFPIYCGSGIDESNVAELFKIANGAIVSTSLKEGSTNTKEVNMKPYDARISEEKTRRLVEAAKRRS